MKVLWLCNIPLPIISNDCNLPVSNAGGWLTGLACDMLNSEKIHLAICFPVYQQKDLLMGKIGQMNYFGFPKQISDPTKYEVNVEIYLQEIIKKVKPDLIHIWGTEFPHSFSMTKVFAAPNKTVISIQGLCSIYADHYYGYLPYKTIRKFSLRDIIRHDNIIHQKKNFIKRGSFELEALKNVNHIIGRTNWDRACAFQINSNASYHVCNETLRDQFYQNQWDINRCEKHSIFLSQGAYPIKGLHMAIKALPQILKVFPDTRLYVAGYNIVKSDTIKEKLKLSSYGKYIKQLISKYKLTKNVIFAGNLDEGQMCGRFLKSHVFLSASSIENSPNSLGEAMLLGVPCVSSDVGGVSDMLVHKEEGFVYPADEYYMISYYVTEIFKSDDLALKFSQNARSHAKITHDREINLNTILKIYNEINELPR